MVPVLGLTAQYAKAYPFHKGKSIVPTQSVCNSSTGKEVPWSDGVKTNVPLRQRITADIGFQQGGASIHPRRH